MDLGVLPFDVQLPAGYLFGASGSSTQDSSSSPDSSASQPADIISISNSWEAGSFTAAANDTYRLGDLIHANAPSGQNIAGYRIALGDGGGTLWLNNTDVSTRTTFTADEFAKLTYTVADEGTQQDLVVVAQTGTRLTSGTLTHITDSAAVQITAKVTGSRSINAINALVTPTSTRADSDIKAVVGESAIYSGFGTGRPTLATVGNFTAETNDTYRLSDLFKASAPAGQTLVGYRVALGDGGGKLWLKGNDVTDRTSFTADEFAKLTYTTGDQDTQQSLLLVAQTGTRLTSGALTHMIDSTPVQIIANVTGDRSINALNALATPTTTKVDTATRSVVSEAIIATGANRPTLATAGNFTAAADDTYRLGDLFAGSAAAGQKIAGYRIALGEGEGRLWLNGKDVSEQTSFTADEFAKLTYTVGSQDTQQSLVVAAQTGTRLASGTLTHVTDSAAVQIIAGVTGDRSINALHALATPATTDVDIATQAVVSEASIYGGFGAGRPTLTTAGNFTAAADDSYRLGDLFAGSAPAGQMVAGYRVALGAGDGKLWLKGTDVSDRTSFTADEFARLTYVAGGQDSQQSLVVVAQTGTRLANGLLTHVTDSLAVQIAAAVTGSRSINALHALATQTTTKVDTATATVVSEASILNGTGSGRPTLRTVGNFTALANDTYRLGDLFKGSAPTGQSIAGYRIALGEGDGKLWLKGLDVSDRTSFTADEFARLTYVAGNEGSQQSMVVMAQIGTRRTDGALTHVTDSPALQITAAVGTLRSINALNALATATTTRAETDFKIVAGEASVLTGFGEGRPTLLTALAPEPPVPLEDLPPTAAAYNSAGTLQSGSEADISLNYPGALSGSIGPGSFTNAGNAALTALLLLGGVATGAFLEAGDLDAQSMAIKAYNIAQGL